MRILLVHNKYKQAGGEDVVFKSESELLSSQGHLVDHLVFDNASIKTWFDKILSGFWSLYNPASARMLRKKIRQFSPDIIHVHNLVPLASPSVLFVAKKFNIPLILTLHNYRLICPSATLFYKDKIYEKSLRSFFPIDAIIKRVYRNSFFETAAIAFMTMIHNIIGTWQNRVDAFIVLSHFAREKFIQSSLMVDESRFLVKHNAVEDCGQGAETRRDFFLFVGRLSEEKGINVMLKAAKLFQFKLVIIGDGPMRKKVENSAANNSNICYLGFQNKPVIMDYVKRCKAFLFPSLWYEGFPLTILEALSAGTIVVASKLGAIEEMIQDRANGLLFEAGNEKDLVCRIAEIRDNMVDVQALSRNARASYLEHYTPQKNYAMLMKIYYGALARKSQPEWFKNGCQLKST